MIKKICPVCKKEIKKFVKKNGKKYFSKEYTNRVKYCSVKCRGKAKPISINEYIVDKDSDYVFVVLKTKKGNIYTFIDKDCLYRIKKYYWALNGNGYVVGYNKKIKHIYLHRLVLNANSKQHIDHIDRNPLNNTRNNLRILTHRANLLNNNCLNIYRSKSHNKWEIKIGRNGYYGLYKDKATAIKYAALIKERILEQLKSKIED